MADQNDGGKVQGNDYAAGPVWHLAVPDETDDARKVTLQDENWFDAPVFAHAWWQEEKIRLLLCFDCSARIKGTIISIKADGTWSVLREEKKYSLTIIFTVLQSG